MASTERTTSGSLGAAIGDAQLTSFVKSARFLELLDVFVDGAPGSSPTSHDGREKEGKGAEEKKRRKEEEQETLEEMMAILDEYQEQPYLLDPFLERIVLPPVHILRRYVRRSFETGTALEPEEESKLAQTARLLYLYTKVRGYKTVVRFFPHEVPDLLPVLFFLRNLTPSMSPSPSSRLAHWELRYVLLLWLSLICMIPFDLDRFDELEGDAKVGGSAGLAWEGLPTAAKMEAFGRVYLGAAGKERDAAAVMLGKLFQRRDASEQRLQAFLSWCGERLSEKPAIFLATGILQALCALVKASDPAFLSPYFSAIDDILNCYEDFLQLSENSLVAKHTAKLAQRLALKLLPPRERRGRKRAKLLVDPAAQASELVVAPPTDVDDEDEGDVPEAVDRYVEKMVEALQHKDTTVRNSASKGVARMCARLPATFVVQVLDAVRSLFSINTFENKGKLDLTSASEHTWHGACLALAELARRGLLSPEELGDTIGWVEKALFFDVRRGAHSVGSGVRDAACYVLWSFARAYDPGEMAPFALDLAQHLVVVATLDREIHIRRAASAAYQEGVGRWGLFPHGIGILRKTDFYAVSIRRNSFLIACPQVAEHDEYRRRLADHLIDVTLAHWDPAMRQLGSQALRAVASIRLDELGPLIIEREEKNLLDKDQIVVHGALLALAEVAGAYREKEGPSGQAVLQAFQSLFKLPVSHLRSYGGALIVSAACYVIAQSASSTALAQPGAGDLMRTVVDTALARPEEDVQIMAAEAFASVSRFRSCTKDVERIIREFPSSGDILQQSYARLLGRIDYAGKSRDGFAPACSLLLTIVEPKSLEYVANVQVRRNAYEAMAVALTSLAGSLPDVATPSIVSRILQALLTGMEDYTTDQRGDVGSWVRLVCIRSLRNVCQSVFSLAHEGLLDDVNEWISRAAYHNVIGALLKQSVERMDGVRQEAGNGLIALCYSSAKPEQLAPAGLNLFEAQFPEGEVYHFQDATWLFPRAVQLLQIPTYRRPLLSGIVLSIGGRTEAAFRTIGASLVDYGTTLPIEAASTSDFNRVTLLEELVDLARGNLAANRVFIPALQALNLLLEGEVFAPLDGSDAIASLGSLLSLSTRQIGKIKNVQRIIASMNVTVNLYAFGSLRARVLATLPLFLCHTFPKIREAASEKLYLVVQTLDAAAEGEEGCLDTERLAEAEEILLGTAWLTGDKDELGAASSLLMKLLA